MSDPIHAPLTVRERFAYAAALKAEKAIRRHGEDSIQARKSLRSRWLRG